MVATTTETQQGTFDPTRHLIDLGRGQGLYLEAKWRIVWLREEHPDATIETEMVRWDGTEAVFRARVGIPGGGSATGWGSETKGDFPRGPLEKAETKAIARALAALGYGTQFAAELDEGTSAQSGERRIADTPVQQATPYRGGNAPISNERQQFQAQGGQVRGQGDPNLATANQVRFARSLAEQAGVDPDTLAAQVREDFGKATLEELTKQEISRLIDGLK
jgi:hypothetical protein